MQLWFQIEIKFSLVIFGSPLFKSLGTQLQLSTAYHPQTDGQTERINQCLEAYLRCMCSQRPKRWSEWLSLVEWWYNTHYHNGAQLTLFQALYGYQAPCLPFNQFGKIIDHTAKAFFSLRNQIIQLLKSNLHQAQHCMKFYAYTNPSERSFEVGNMVYLRVRLYRQLSMTQSNILSWIPSIMVLFCYWLELVLWLTGCNYQWKLVSILSFLFLFLRKILVHMMLFLLCYLQLILMASWWSSI